MKKTIIGVIMVTILLVGNLFVLQVRADHALDIAIVEYPPYEFTRVDSQGEVHFDGMSVKLVEEVFRRIKQPIAFQVLPWSRALKLLKEGKIDGLFEVLIRPERQVYADYSQQVLMQEVVMLFVTEDSDIEFNGELGALGDYHFGMRKDFSYGTIFDSAVETKVIKQLSVDVKSSTLLLKLCTGDIDILIAEKDTIFYVNNEIKKLQTDSLKRCKNIKRLTKEVQSTPTYMTFSKKSHLSHVRDQFDLTLLQMKQDGSYQKIIDEWKLENIE
ncbi:amino acid ABC transporter substrate-binding protein, PAAT family [Shewanella psychrophila]|uniref:Amino acid ABC transporter substrate-binding protein, PAAT family n=1 Tax=Shewanella psychrophila TaxID=225848 RepID=A0A1S6HR25_9GAMM|nr:transporter substrate-binding domain-containing protein [Shewanella psychrophila]AQS37980.1 amino acid ABC transporter substrate-binding protein, PAAT family [Shewanella psychrophila]